MDEINTKAISEAEQVPLFTLKKRFRLSNLSQRWQSLSAYLGPAFIVSVAYIDPGNFATNISSGTVFNYTLVWVVLWSNICAIFLQSLSAKLGIATNKNLPQLCRENFCRGTNWCFWSIATLAAMATDLAEFLGGVLGFYLLFGIPLIWGGLLTGIISFIIAALKTKGQRLVEAIIGCFVAVIGVAYVMELFLARPDWRQTVFHTLVPSIPNSKALLLAVGMLGATVMPHVIYLHSELVQHRRGREDNHHECLQHYKMEKWDIGIAMNLAFIVNAAMVVVSAAVFHAHGLNILTIQDAHRSLAPLLGAFSSVAFGLALLASGLSSSTVGTLSGEIIINGFVGLNVSLTVRRLITMTPAIVILLMGYNPMDALVISQVCLSFALPAAIIPLILLTGKRAVMGTMANSRVINLIGWVIAGVIIGLNVTLLWFTFLNI